MKAFRFCRPSLLLVSLLLPVAAFGADPVDLTASSSYREHFRPMQDASLFAPGDSALVGRMAAQFYGGALYTPSGNGQLFSGETIEATFSLAGEQGVRTLFHLVARYDEESQMALVGRVIIPSASRIRLQILCNASPYLSPQNQSSKLLVDWEYDLASGGEGAYRPAHNRRGCSGGEPGTSVPPETVLIARLEQRETPERAFCLTLLDEGGRLLGTTGFQAAQALETVTASGAAGFGAYVAKGDEVRVYSFKVASTP